MGKGRYLAPLLHHQPGHGWHGLSVLQIGGSGVWKLVDLMCSSNKEPCKFSFALGTTNYIPGHDSKVFISRSLFCVANGIYACMLNISPWLFLRHFKFSTSNTEFIISAPNLFL